MPPEMRSFILGLCGLSGRLRGRRQRMGLALGPMLAVIAAWGLHASGLDWPPSWAAGVVVLMASWWITEPLPLWGTACLPLILFPLLEIAPLPGVLLQYLDPVNFLFLGGMWIAACMRQWGLHRRIALGIVAAIGCSPPRIVLGFMLGTAFMTLWISNTAAAMMMFPIGMAVLSKFEENTGPDHPDLRRFGLALMLGIAYAASIGGIGTKIGTGTNLVFIKNSTDVLPEGVDFLTWLKMGLPVVALSIPIAWAYLVYVGARVPRGDFAGGAEAIHSERARLGPISPGEKVALTAFLSAAFLWIFLKDMDLGGFVIPGWSRLWPWGWENVLPMANWEPGTRKMFNDTGDAVVAMVVALLLFIIPVRNPRRSFALDIPHAKQVAWGLLVLLGGGFAMAHGIQQSGLSDEIAGIMGNMGNLHPFTAILLVSLVSVVLTEVASNTATASILLPILAVTAPTVGLHPAPLMLAATLSASFGFMLPAGTPPNAIVFASGYITVPKMARCGFAVDAVGTVIITILCAYWVPKILGIPLRLPITPPIP